VNFFTLPNIRGSETLLSRDREGAVILLTTSPRSNSKQMRGSSYEKRVA
jgi:hypothetical protein